MTTVAAMLAWLKPALKDAASLEVGEESTREEVESGECEPWFEIGKQGYSWLIQACYESESVLVKTAAGQELMYLPLSLGRVTILSRILQFTVIPTRRRQRNEEPNDGRLQA